MGRWGSSHLIEIYFLCEIYDKVISWRAGQRRVCWRVKRREGSVMVSSEIGKLNFLGKCSRFFWQCWVRFVVMFVPSLVSKSGSFFSSNVQLLWCRHRKHKLSLGCGLPAPPTEGERGKEAKYRERSNIGNGSEACWWTGRDAQALCKPSCPHPDPVLLAWKEQHRQWARGMLVDRERRTGVM